MGIFQFLWNFFFGSFEWIFSFINEWSSQAEAAGFSPTTGGIIGISILMIIPVGSGLTAMTIAEIKQRERFLHLFLGMLLPIAYPILLYFVLPEFKILSQEEKKIDEIIEHMHAEESVPDSELRSVAKADKKGIALEVEQGIVLDQRYFSRISTDESGNPTGPFMLELDDGRILEIESISGALSYALAVEINQEGGAPSKTIRLPYEKINACHLKDEWLNDADADVDYDEEGEEA